MMKNNVFQNKRCIKLIIFIVLVSIISISLYYTYDTKPDNLVENSILKNISGVYTKDEYNIYVFLTIDNHLLFFEENDSSFSGTGIMSNGKYSVMILGENYELLFDENELTIVSDSANSHIGKYQKQSDLTEEEFYKKKYNYDESLATEYNGIYKYDDKVVYLYKKDETKLSICYTLKEQFSCMIHEFEQENKIASFPKSDNQLFKVEIFDGGIRVYDNDGNDTDYTGEYQKESSLTVKELQNLKYPIY